MLTNPPQQQLIHSVALVAVVIVVLGASARGFVIQRFTIPSESMQPTLMAGDTIYVRERLF